MQKEKVKSLKINVTNLRSALLDANKTLEEISSEKKSLLEKQVQQQKIKEKEDKLTTKRSPIKKAGEAVKSAAKGVQGFFDKVILYITFFIFIYLFIYKSATNQSFSTSHNNFTTPPPTA